MLTHSLTISGVMYKILDAFIKDCSIVSCFYLYLSTIELQFWWLQIDWVSGQLH